MRDEMCGKPPTEVAGDSILQRGPRDDGAAPRELTRQVHQGRLPESEGFESVQRNLVESSEFRKISRR